MVFFTKRPVVAIETWRLATSVLVIWSIRPTHRSPVRYLGMNKIEEPEGLVRRRANTAVLCEESRHDMAVHV